MNIEFLMAARARIVYQGITQLTAALLDRPDNDSLVATSEDSQKAMRGAANKSPLDALELLIAQRVDDGERLPLSNPEAYAAAQWLARGDLASLPDPIPRAFVLYLAQAWKNADHYDTVKSAMTDILNTRTFV